MFSRNSRPRQLLPLPEIQFLELRGQSQFAAISFHQLRRQLHTPLRRAGIDQVELRQPRQRGLYISFRAFRKRNIGAAVTDASCHRRRGVTNQKEFHDASTAR